MEIAGGFTPIGSSGKTTRIAVFFEIVSLFKPSSFGLAVLFCGGLRAGCRVLQTGRYVSGEHEQVPCPDWQFGKERRRFENQRRPIGDGH